MFMLYLPTGQLILKKISGHLYHQRKMAILFIISGKRGKVIMRFQQIQ